MIRGSILVTGSSGLIGRALVTRLNALGADVTGVSRYTSPVAVQADVTDRAATAKMLDHVSPKSVVHLAGAASGGREELYRANVVTTRNLLEAVAAREPAPGLIVAGSAAEYGAPITDRVAEDHPSLPLTDYGRAKAQQSTLVKHVAAAAGLRYSIIRPFNIVSSELPDTVALGNIRRQLLAGSGPHRTIHCGRLDVVRDFIPLEFVVDTIVRLLALDGWPPILNICSGVGIELSELVERLGFSLGVEVEAEIEPDLKALAAPTRIVGDPTRLERLGLASLASVETLASLMLGPPAQSARAWRR